MAKLALYEPVIQQETSPRTQHFRGNKYNPERKKIQMGQGSGELVSALQINLFWSLLNDNSVWEWEYNSKENYMVIKRKTRKIIYRK